MPARRAASTFSLMPPTGSTRPVSVISPVMAVSLRTGMSRVQRGQRRRHGHAGRRAVLGHRAGRHVDVHARRAEQRRDRCRAARRATRRSSGPPGPTRASRRRAGRSDAGRWPSGQQRWLRRRARRRRPRSRPGRWRRPAGRSCGTCSGGTRSGPSNSARSAGSTVDRLGVALGEPPGHLARDPAERPLQLAHAGFAGVAADDALRASRRECVSCSGVRPACCSCRGSR